MQASVRNVGTHGLMLREYIKWKNHKIRVDRPWKLKYLEYTFYPKRVKWE
jgi:methylaspartate ammonia-lyase